MGAFFSKVRSERRSLGVKKTNISPEFMIHTQRATAELVLGETAPGSQWENYTL